MQHTARLSGEQVKAITVALEFFSGMPDIPPQKKELSHYSTVEVRDEGHRYAVKLIPKLLPRDRMTRGGETSLGVEITFFVDKATWQIVRIQRYQ